MQGSFFYVGPPKEDILSGHLLCPIFQSTLHITFTSLCLGVDTVRFSCLYKDVRALTAVSDIYFNVVMNLDENNISKHAAPK